MIKQNQINLFHYKPFNVMVKYLSQLKQSQFIFKRQTTLIIPSKQNHSLSSKTIYNKIMNDSFASADDNRQIPNNLYVQINCINTNQWKADDFEFSPCISGQHHMSQNQAQNTSFDCQLPLQSKIIQPILEVHQPPANQEAAPQQLKQEINESDNKQQQKQQPQPSTFSSQGKIPSQMTITFHQKSIVSKIYEQIDTDDSSSFSTSLKSFLTLSDKNYRPHLICMKYLYDQLKDYSKKSLQNLKLYINFLEIKMKQEIQSLKLLDQIQINGQVGESQEGEDDVNMDEKVITNQIKNQNLRRREKRKLFYINIKDVYEKLLMTWRKIKEKRQKRERYIDEQIVRVIDRIQLQMQDMIKCRLLNEKQKVDHKFISEMIRSQNPYLSKDKYLQMKYLMQRQNSYLQLIHDFNGKLITYLVSMFSKQEVQICKSIKESMIQYATIYVDCYDNQNQILNMKVQTLEESNCDQNVKNQLTDYLLTILPKQLYNLSDRKINISCGNQRLQSLLSDFSSSLQNTIFLTTIQMNNQYILFRNQAVWRTNAELLEKDQSAADYQSKQVLAQSLSNRNANKAHQFVPQQLDAKIVVVLTSNYFLHLELDDKIASMRLGDIKLSRKGRQIIIADRGKGLGGYFGFKKQLGRLQFESTEEVDIFAKKLSHALRKIG